MADRSSTGMVALRSALQIFFIVGKDYLFWEDCLIKYWFQISRQTPAAAEINIMN
jgi:hypothetical protein